MRRPAAYLVWNPSRGMPTRGHDTFEKADAERARLRAEQPKHEFWVMAPVRSKTAATAAKAFSDGKAEGLAQAHAEIMLAEGRADHFADQASDLRQRLGALAGIGGDAEDFQAVVADCLCWFDGFRAAHHHEADYERPQTPSRDNLARLNSALQAVVRGQRNVMLDDQEIPF